MGLDRQLDEALRQAMRAGDALRVSTIRLARAAIQNAEIEKRRPLTEDELQDILQHEVKRRREAIEGFQRGGREDLAHKESLEMAILLGYLPPPFAEDDLRRIIAEAVTATGAASPRDAGRIMAVVMPKVRGRAEGATVNRLVREALGG